MTLIVSLQANATDTPKVPQYATRDELRGCMNADDALKATRKKVNENMARNQASLATVQLEAVELVDEQRRVDATDNTAIDAFNDKMAAHNKRVEQVNAQASVFKAGSDAYNDELLEYNRRCSTLVYRIDDRNAILKEREAGHK
ncbi:MAG: hypothetical protein ABI605_08730 [Rhizobacter sp.]